MADLVTAISIPEWSRESSNYFAIFSGDNIRIYEGCPPRPVTSSTSVDYQQFNAIYGFAVSEGSSNISRTTFTLDSPDCASSDTGPHGTIAITDNSLDVLAFMPFKPFYFALSIFTFVWILMFIIHLFFGRRMNT